VSDDLYRKADHWILDDRSGLRIRASEARMEWNGALVHQDDWEPRHPQDFVRGVKDDQRVQNPRPDIVPTFIGQLTASVTADAATGATSVTLDETARFNIGDTIGLYAGGDLQRVVVAAIPDEFTLTFAPALRGPVLTGTLIQDFSAIAPANIG